MLNNNYFLREAVEKAFDYTVLVNDIKKAMNACALTKFRSKDACLLFYEGFFLNSVKEDVTLEDWMQTYQTLSQDAKFTENLAYYIAIFRPAQYVGMFQPLTNILNAELSMLKKDRMVYLGKAKAFFSFMVTYFDSVKNIVIAKTNDADAVKFLTQINSTLTTAQFYTAHLIEKEVTNDYNPDDVYHIYQGPLEEDVQALINLFENGQEIMDDLITQYMMESMNESIVNKVKEKAKMAHVAKLKAEKAFDERVMKLYKDIVTHRRNRKHAEMVGDALRISHEIKRLLYTLPLSLINPAWTVIAWVISVVIDRETDKKDRDILVGQLRDEIEICDEKISMAERNGDDKGKIELMRLRQKLQKEYSRIMKLPYTNARNQNRN